MFAFSSRLQSLKSVAITSESTLGDPTTDGAKSLLVPGKVISSTRIPHGALSMPIHPLSLRGETEVMQILVGVNQFGTLDLDENSKHLWNPNIHWTRALRLADDCHSYNIQLRKDPHKLVLQAVRPVEPGQELLLWFSEEILASIHMGFLTPANIQGEKNYVCTRCSALYESPNPLKLHLTLGCGRQSMCSLWEKLSSALREPVRSLSNEFHFKLINEPSLPKQKNAIDLSTPPEKKLRDSSEPFKPYNSAFKPVRKSLVPASSSASKFGNNNSMVYSSYTSWPRFTMPSDYVHTPYVANQMRLQTNCDDDAHIESLVSSLGKYKEGHICLYCGKSYSRKYGLKIHIRTHTGYKPLKCKYCLRPFGDPSNLNKHVRLHAEGETPYKCDICGKVLVRRRDLDRHLKSRHTSDSTSAEFLNDDDSITSVDGSLSDEDCKIAEDSKVHAVEEAPTNSTESTCRSN